MSYSNYQKDTDKIYFKCFNDEIVQSEEAVECIFELFLKRFPIENYVPERLFQGHRPTDDALHQEMKEHYREIEWHFLEFFAKRYKNEDTVKVETKNAWLGFENFLETAGEKQGMEGITSKKFLFSFK